jgi:hypothetical protein
MKLGYHRFSQVVQLEHENCKEMSLSKYKFTLQFTSCTSWLRYYATSLKVSISIPDEVIEFLCNLLNATSHTKTWGSLSL